MKIGKLEIDLEDMKRFIIEAKKNGYAGRKEKVREADGSKTFAFQKGNFYYADNYAGSYQAPGTETVRWQKEKGQRIWQMAYSGGMSPEFWGNEKLAEQTFEFLREALMKGDSEYPLRGPPHYSSNGFVYMMKARGDIRRFSGDEQIIEREPNRIVFSQEFIGGLIIPK